MPIAPTYPGVYIEEIPSGVHTITGVATSITAFVGYTARGPVDHAVHIFGFADFERQFGPVAPDSLLSHTVKHFFQNGGTEGYVVRTAAGAHKASVTMKDGSDAGAHNVLKINASSEGVWGNNLRVTVDNDSADPKALFNLSVTEFITRDGSLVVGRTETFGNLSMDTMHPSYAVNVINAKSELVIAEPVPGAPAGARPMPSGTVRTPVHTASVTTGELDPPPPIKTNDELHYVVNGVAADPPLKYEQAPDLATLADILAWLQKKIPNTEVAISGKKLVFTTSNADPNRLGTISFQPGDNPLTSIAAKLKLLEGDGATSSGRFRITVHRDATAVKADINIPLDPSLAAPTTLIELASQYQRRIDTASRDSGNETLRGSTVRVVADAIQVLPAPSDSGVWFEFFDGDDAKAAPNQTANVAAYAPGAGNTARGQLQGLAGTNGTAPGSAELTGSRADKTGIYALEDVDLFNLLVMPDATEGQGLLAALSETITYCEERRAFVIVDVPSDFDNFDKAYSWIGGGDGASLRSRNVGFYYPRLRLPDPLNPSVVKSYPAAGALAGLFARTDADRGVWKAPAGTTATLEGAVGLSEKLSDPQNGTLNPLGLNCLRLFPVYGAVSWGARTGNGADAMADDYKYVPVRRLALYLEESLYRGTQWVVFEPNDEPLWAQIRLNLGAFMHNLFAQGAFKGRTPREAFFVKCDKETTTQNDIDLGRVNIVVGFAPLKPAEFVIIQIQQIAGAIQA
jgi:phage tail sheath protein FI